MDAWIKGGLPILIGMFVASLLWLLESYIIFRMRNKEKNYKWRRLVYGIYRSVNMIKLAIMSLVAFYTGAFFTYIITYFITFFIYSVLMIFSIWSSPAQLSFIHKTLSLILFYPFSVMFIKHMTLKECRIINKNDLKAAMYYYFIDFMKKLPIKEMVNVFYIVMLMISSISKVGGKDIEFVFDTNEYFMSFTLYLAIYSASDSIYKKYKIYFDKLNDKIFKTSQYKKVARNINIKADLKQQKRDIKEFILTGKELKDNKKWRKYQKFILSKYNDKK